MNRPVISIQLDKWDIWMDITAWTFLILLWIYPLNHYAALPNQIPTHFGLNGKADGYGDKQTILLLPIIATVLNIALRILEKFPHRFNYPITITTKNASYQYQFAIKVLRVLRILISVFFLLIVYRVLISIQTGEHSLGKSIIACIIGLCMIPSLLTLLMWRKGRARQ